MGQIPRSLPTKLAERIECFDDERACGNGYVVTLHYGWTIDPGKHCGVFGADSVREVHEMLKRATPCHCGGSRELSPPTRSVCCPHAWQVSDRPVRSRGFIARSSRLIQLDRVTCRKLTTCIRATAAGNLKESPNEHRTESANYRVDHFSSPLCRTAAKEGF